MKKDINIVIGQVLEERRKELNYSYTQLAELTGISRSSLQHYFVDYADMPIGKFIDIAKGLNLDPGEILDTIAQETFNRLDIQKQIEMLRKIKSYQ